MVDKDLQNNNSNSNVFVRIFKTFIQFIRNVFYDFFTSFKYNHMKLPGILVALPGIFIGFLLSSHVETIDIMLLNKDGTNYAGIFIFILMLFGILNIFTAASLMGKKNLGSVVTATVSTLVIVVAGGAYIWNFFYSLNLLKSGDISLASGAKDISLDNYISLVFVIISIVSSVVGVILGYIFYDRTYEKVTR